VAIADLTRRLSSAGQLLVKELSAFGIVGIACFAIDVGLFQVLYANVGLGPVTAKLLSTLVSTAVAYIAHRYWSFSHRTSYNRRREYLIFAAVNAITLLLSLGVVAFVHHVLGQDSSLMLQVANVGSIAAGTVIRFLSYRRWVFPAASSLPGTGEHDPALTA
jgi:putative flippase GtrA